MKIPKELKSQLSHAQNTVKATDSWLELDGLPSYTEVLKRLRACCAALSLIHKLNPEIKTGEYRLSKAQITLGRLHGKNI